MVPRRFLKAFFLAIHGNWWIWYKCTGIIRMTQFLFCVCVSVSWYACMFTCFWAYICEFTFACVHMHMWNSRGWCWEPHTNTLIYLLRQDLSLAVRSYEQTNLAGQLTSGISAFWAGWNYKPAIKGIELLSGFWGSRLWTSLSTEPSPDPNLFLIMYVLASFRLLW